MELGYRRTGGGKPANSVGNYAGPSPTLLIIDCDGRDYFFDSQFDG